MRVQQVQRHFPFLLGRLPRMVLSLPGSLVALGKRFAVELSLAIPFVALFVATIAGDWAGFFWLSAVVIAAVVLPLSSLVLLLMVRQHQGRRRPQSRWNE